MNTASATVKPTAVSRTFHHGRPSWMSYAWLSVSMIAVMPDEVLQIVPSMPSVSRPPSLSCAIFRI